MATCIVSILFFFVVACTYWYPVLQFASMQQLHITICHVHMPEVTGTCSMLGSSYMTSIYSPPYTKSAAFRLMQLVPLHACMLALALPCMV